MPNSGLGLLARLLVQRRPAHSLVCPDFQLIQDEIKALLQLQNRQTGILAHADFSAPPPAKSPADTKDAYVFPLVHSDPVGPAQSHRLAAPVQSAFSSPSPPLPKAESNNQGEEPTTTVLSSGYGTLTAWEASLGSPKGGLEGTEYLRWSSDIQERSETPATTFQLQFSGGKADGVNDPAENQQKTTEYVRSPVADLLDSVRPQIWIDGSLPALFFCRDGQQFTSWAQRQKLRPRKSKSEQASPETPEDPGPAHSVSKPSTQTCQEVRDQVQEPVLVVWMTVFCCESPDSNLSLVSASSRQAAVQLPPPDEERQPDVRDLR